MVKIAVLDDQESYFNSIEVITKKFMSERAISYEIFTYISPEDLLYDIAEDNKYDIYLLDVELPTISGLEVARKIREKYYEPIIIYITNYVEYAIEGYEVNAYRYIPKIMLEQKLPEAYALICPSIENKKKEFYIIEKNHKLERIAYEDIYYIKKDKKYIFIVHKYGISNDRKTIVEFIESVKNYDLFIEVDRSYIVNILHVMSLKDQKIILRNGDSIPISKPKLSYVKKEIMKIWRN